MEQVQSKIVAGQLELVSSSKRKLKYVLVELCFKRLITVEFRLLFGLVLIEDS